MLLGGSLAGRRAPFWRPQGLQGIPLDIGSCLVGFVYCGDAAFAGRAHIWSYNYVHVEAVSTASA